MLVLALSTTVSIGLHAPMMVVGGAHCRATLRMNLFDNIAKAVAQSMQEVTVQHILLPGQTDAVNLYDQMTEEPVSPEAMGKYAALRSQCGSAKKRPDARMSQLRGQPGELKFRRGSMAPEFEKVAFEAPIGELQRPFETQFGWHLMLVNSRSGYGPQPPR